MVARFVYIDQRRASDDTGTAAFFFFFFGENVSDCPRGAGSLTEELTTRCQPLYRWDVNHLCFTCYIYSLYAYIGHRAAL